MGQNDRQEQKGRSPHTRRFSSRETRKYDLSELALDAMLGCIGAAISAGGAIRIGSTRDGGALAIGIYGDGDPYTEYLRAGDGGEQFFNDLRLMFEGLADEAARLRKATDR